MTNNKEDIRDFIRKNYAEVAAVEGAVVVVL